jgi:hypothetical protein
VTPAAAAEIRLFFIGWGILMAILAVHPDARLLNKLKRVRPATTPERVVTFVVGMAIVVAALLGWLPGLN